jgi:tetratricopeptide (TPR) repeat protein
MRTFFLFYLLNALLGNPFVALLVLGLGFWMVEAQWSGRYFNPTSWLQRRTEMQGLADRVKNNPHDVSAHNDLGRLLFLRGKTRAALEHLRKAVVRMDDSAETQFWLGRALLAEGSNTDAQTHLRQALELEPRHNYGQPWVVLARALFEAGAHEEAAKAAASAVAINTSSVEGWLLQGLARKQAGEHEEAKRCLEAARTSFDGLPRYLRPQARTFMRQARKAAREL